MSDKLKRLYADKLHWLEMGIPYSESETNPHEMVFSLAMRWEDVVPLLQHIAELEAELQKCAKNCDYYHEFAMKAEARLDAVAAGYREAIEDIESWAAYADDYFQKKHDLAGTLAKHRAALEQEEGAT